MLFNIVSALQQLLQYVVKQADTFISLYILSIATGVMLKENTQLLNFTDLKDNRFYCFQIKMPSTVEFTPFIGIREIMDCGFATTLSEVGTITKDFKK